RTRLRLIRFGTVRLRTRVRRSRRWMLVARRRLWTIHFRTAVRRRLSRLRTTRLRAKAWIRLVRLRPVVWLAGFGPIRLRRGLSVVTRWRLRRATGGADILGAVGWG